jgi:hypothetical protein
VTLFQCRLERGLAQSVSGCSPNMQAYWKLDESGGGTYEDLLDINGRNNGVCSDRCPQPVAEGKIAGGQQFTRDLSTGINALGGSFNWTGNASFSIELWMKKDTPCSDLTSSGNEVLVGRDSASTPLHWWVGIDCSAGGVPAFVLIDNGGTESIAIGTRLLADGKWHHIVAVRDGVNGKTLLYVDG